MKEVEEHTKYLGLPTIIGREKKSVFGVLVDKVKKKIKLWKSQCLSNAAKEVLIKAVAQAQATYTMYVFLVPDGVLDELRSAILNFWWGQKKEEKRIPWKAWKKLCEPKATGGLGFRDLKVFNLALLRKQIWNLMQNPDSLVARVLKAKYHPNSDILHARMGYNPSYVWRSLMAAQELVRYGVRWRIGNGTEVEIWRDRWFPEVEGGNQLVTSPVTNLGISAKVSALIDHSTQRWRSNVIQQNFNSLDRARILSIPLPRFPQPDKQISCSTICP